VDYHFVREKVANKDILLQHIPTSLQPADIFTKGHTANRFYFFRDKLSVIDFPASLWENDKDKAHYTKIVERYWDLTPSCLIFVSLFILNFPFCKQTLVKINLL
jgi:hypothetical protein